jgi:autotransporter passenger strand-loop-strand repeat protein
VTVSSGQSQTISAGESASGTTILHGGDLVVSSGGVADATRIDGGLEMVMSGGIANGATINRGGTLEFAAADTGITQDIRFGSGFGDAAFGGFLGNRGGGTATLKFDAAATSDAGLIYGGVISGFGAGDAIDLAGLGFVSGQTSATSVLSGSNTLLTIANGSQSVALTLAGNQTSDTFAVTSDGSGGTVITDQSGSLGWLDNHFRSLVSDYGVQGLDNGFSRLLNEINGTARAGAGSTSDGTNQSGGQTIWLDAGWHSNLVHAMASFGDANGGLSQAGPQGAMPLSASETIVANNTAHHA